MAKALRHQEGGRWKASKSGTKALTTGADCCDCQGGGGGGGEWPNTDYVIAQLCPGQAAVPPNHPMVVSLVPADTVECGSVFLNSPVPRCWQITKGYDGIDAADLPPGSVVLSFDPNVSCCRCRALSAFPTTPECTAGTFCNALPCSGGSLLAFAGYSTLALCRNSWTANLLLERMSLEGYRAKCCCGPATSLTHSVTMRWTYTYSGITDVIELTTGAVFDRNGNGFPRYLFNDHRVYGVSGAETNTTGVTGYMACGPGVAVNPFSGLAFFGLMSCGILVSLDASFTCDRAAMSYETYDAENDARTTYSIEATVGRSKFSNSCGNGCDDDDDPSGVGRPGGGTRRVLQGLFQ